MEDINELEGRELDAAVAEEIMRLVVEKLVVEQNSGTPPLLYSPELGRAVPHYSTDIAAAWEVVKYINHELGWALELQQRNGWCAQWKNIDGPIVSWDGPYDSAPEAICRTALKATRAANG